MVTLTYRDADGWHARHVSDFLSCVRKHYARRGWDFRYVWVAEVQPQRGVLHYHVALWIPAGERLPYPDEQGWWPHGSTRIEWARAAVPYLLKYLSKGDDVKGFPKGARSYGCGGMSHQLRRARRWLGLPSFVQARADIRDDAERVVGGGWRVRGSYYASEFRRVSVNGVIALKRDFKHRIADDTWSPAGPFSWLGDWRPADHPGGSSCSSCR